MRTINYHTNDASIIFPKNDTSQFFDIQREHAEKEIDQAVFTHMAEGRLPDLRETCLTIAGIMLGTQAPTSAKELIPVLNALPILDEPTIKGLLKNRVTRHVLISGERYEVILNHWEPGKATDIHGHPSGGCIFKLLYGKVEESRFTPTSSPQLTGSSCYNTGSMGYIDNESAYHKVGNPFDRSAVSIHVYLKN